MRHTPGKRYALARESRHKITRSAIAHMAAAALARGDAMQAQRFGQMLDRAEGHRALNQRQQRKARRQRWAAGDRRAFN